MNPPPNPKFVESELMSVKGRREGEENGFGGCGADDISKRGRLFTRADKVGGVGVGVEVPPSIG
jgi:hypothetical protein